MERTAPRSVARRGLLVAVAVLLLVPGGGPVSATSPRSRIVWAASDGIWTSDSVGGDRKHLVATGAFDDSAYNPRWSHDGQWIAFMRRWAIWVVRADGSDAHVVPTRTRANMPQWSADDQRIYYFLEDGDPGIHWVSVDGSSWGSLTGGDPGRANSLVWSPDGRAGAISILSGGNYAVATTDASGGNRRVILAEAGTHLSPTAWSPDGSKLLVVGAPDKLIDLEKTFEVLVVNVDGTGRRLLRRGAIADAWSPDGRWILFHEPPFGEQFLRILRFDGSGETMLPTVAAGGADWGPGTVDPQPVLPTTTAPPKSTSTSAPTISRPTAPTTAPSSQVPIGGGRGGPGPGSPASTLPPAPVGTTANTEPTPSSPEQGIGRAAAGSAILLGDDVSGQVATSGRQPSTSRGSAVLASVVLLVLAGMSLALRMTPVVRQRGG
jgi:hypothetical protein